MRVVDVSTRSNETSMSRYGLRQSFGTSTTTVAPGGRSAVTVGNAVSISPQGSTAYMGPNATDFVFDPTMQRTLSLVGVDVTVYRFDDDSFTYMLRRRGVGASGRPAEE